MSHFAVDSLSLFLLNILLSTTNKIWSIRYTATSIWYFKSWQ